MNWRHSLTVDARHFPGIMWLFAIIVTLTSPLAAQAAPPSGGGGGNKVTVTAANPSDAFQGEELDVFVSGSGFDAGSTVSYLVTGTSDSSQVEVISVQYISSTELRTRVRPKENALPSEYDIEVRTTSGRKGKGTTLFRVKQNEVACVDTQFPAIAYMTRTDQPQKNGRIKESPQHDFVLVGDTDCTRHTLLSGYPWPGGAMSDLKFILRDGMGLVSWIEKTAMDANGTRLERIVGLFFDVAPEGQVLPAQPEPIILHEVTRGADENLFLVSHDIRLAPDGSPEIALVDFTGSDFRSLRILDPTSGAEEIVLSGFTHFVDSTGTPYRAVGDVNWSPEGSSLVFKVGAVGPDPDPMWFGFAALVHVEDSWQSRLILVNQLEGVDLLFHAGLSPGGDLAFGYRDFRGTFLIRSTGIVNPSTCPQDGCLLGVNVMNDQATRDGEALAWTRSGSLLFRKGGDAVFEWIDPYLGIESALTIENVDSADSSWQ